jgi:hypothetical protein
MAIPDATMKIRRKLATDLRKLSDVLHSYFPTAEISSIESAITQLRNDQFIPQIPHEASNNNLWGYNLNSIIFKFDSIPRHTIPSNCKDLKIILDLNAIGNNYDPVKLDDPLKWLEFNIVIEATKFTDNKPRQVRVSYHLDRHIIGKEETEAEFPHPIYHFQFGGRKLTNESELDTGDLLVLDSPRIGHYPMEAVLGIDFILSNFFPKTWRKMKTESSEYNNLIEEYQEHFIKPYIHMHSSHWKYEHETLTKTITWSPIMICPQLT